MLAFLAEAVCFGGPAFGEVAMVGLPVVLQLTAKRRTKLRNDNSSDRMIRWTKPKVTGVGKLEWKMSVGSGHSTLFDNRARQLSASPVGTQCL